LQDTFEFELGERNLGGQDARFLAIRCGSERILDRIVGVVDVTR